MTAPAQEMAHEVAEAKAALDLIPAEWRTDALDSSVLNRAAFQALDRQLGERAAVAQVRQDVAVAAFAKIVDGDPSGVDDMLTASVEKEAAARLRAHLKVPGIDQDALSVAFALADTKLSESDALIQLPGLAWDHEMTAWRQAVAGRLNPADPPMPTDLDRGTSKRAAALRGEVDAALAYHQNWRQWTANATAHNPLGLLASAAAVLEERKGLAKRVKDVAALIGQANRSRKDAGLNWKSAVAR